MATSARLVRRPGRDRLGEGVFWSARTGTIWWVDILGQRLNRLHLVDERVESWAMPEMICWVIERREAPGLVAGFQSGFALLDLDPLRITALGPLEPDKPGNRMNDAIADREGRVWAGTMPVNGTNPSGALYRLDPDGSVTCVDQGYHIANGPAISPDGHWLYHTDTGLRTVYRFAMEGEGRLGPREIFIRFEDSWGFPDGMTVDAEGGLWIAHWGAGCVSRFSPEGVRERSLALPVTQVTRCAFAGDNLDRMFVTSAAEGVEAAEPDAGGLFEVDPRCRGLAPFLYGG